MENPSGIVLRIRALRAKYPWFDHLAKAGTTYNQRHGDYLAAAVTYFSFLAIFPLLLVATAVLGLFLRFDPDLLDQLQKVVQDNVPGGLGSLFADVLSQARDSATGIGIVSLLFFLYAGIGWIANLRDGVERMWGTPQPEPAFPKDQIRDLLSLAGLGLTILVSVALSAVAGGLTGFLVDLLGLRDVPGAFLITGGVALAAALVADILVFVWVMALLPRQKVAIRSVVKGAIFGMVGFEAIKIIATIYISRLTESPAYAVFGSILGLLFFINLITRLLMFVVSWTATSREQMLVTIEGTPEASMPVPVTLGAPPPRRVVGGGPILAVLLTVGAAVGALIPGVLRRWWNNEKRPT